MDASPVIVHREAQGVLRHMLGWRQQPVDTRDLSLLDDGPARVARLPSVASTRMAAAPPIRDQGQLGTCTQNAGMTAAGFLVMKLTGKPDPLFSRLFGYYQTRKLEGTPESEDSGCFVRDVFKAMRRFGVCLESTWPYVESMFTVEPPQRAYAEALDHRALTFYACPTLAAIKQSLADGYPVIGGFQCYSGIFSDGASKTGKVPMPKPGEASQGGHCVYFDGYNDHTDELNFQQSWGKAWGDNGYGMLPQDMVRQKLATDFVTLRLESLT